MMSVLWGPNSDMGPPRQRLTRIAGYRIGGDQSGGTGTILQTCHELTSFQLLELQLIPASQGCSAARRHGRTRRFDTTEHNLRSTSVSRPLAARLTRLLRARSGSASSAAAKVFPIRAFSFQGSDSLPGLILAICLRTRGACGPRGRARRLDRR